MGGCSYLLNHWPCIKHVLTVSSSQLGRWFPLDKSGGNVLIYWITGHVSGMYSQSHHHSWVDGFPCIKVGGCSYLLNHWPCVRHVLTVFIITAGYTVSLVEQRWDVLISVQAPAGAVLQLAESICWKKYLCGSINNNNNAHLSCAHQRPEHSLPFFLPFSFLTPNMSLKHTIQKGATKYICRTKRMIKPINCLNKHTTTLHSTSF